MKNRVWSYLSLSVVVAVALTAGAATAQDPGVSGRFTLAPHAHSSEFKSPMGADTIFATTPMPFPIASGDYSYSSISCDIPTPFNDISLNFNPDYPGIDDPASTRSFIEASVTQAPQGSRLGTVEGTVTSILCESGDEILISYDGQFTRLSKNSARFTGTFVITGGTGTFEDLEGSGTLQGTFTCLEPILVREGAANCAELGAFSDANFFLRGSFADPTVPNA